MPSRRETTIRHVVVQWDQDGTVVSPRSAQRRRPMAYELGRVLLALADAAEAAQAGASGRGSPCALVAGDLARQVGLGDHDAGVALRELQTRGCLVRQRIPSGTLGTGGTGRESWRRAYGFQLAPASALRGRGRRPPIYPRALLLDPSAACGDLLDVVLHDVGVWAIQVVSAADAERLLAHMAFELVVVDVEAAAPTGAPGLARAIQAAGCGPVLAMTRPSTRDPALLAALGSRAEVPRPFRPEAFTGCVSALGVGAMTTFASFTDLAG